MKKGIGYLYDKKKKNEKMPRTALYDYPMACIAEDAGIDIINVGDSMAMVMLGYESTIFAKLDVMIEHAKAVRRGAPSAFIMGDMPFLSYQTSIPEAIKNAGRYMVEASVDCVKVEGNTEIIDTIAALTKASIPVIAHTGLTPQSVGLLGGYKTQGRDAKSAFALIKMVLEFERAGAIALLLESVPDELAKIIYEKISIPLLGTGTGSYNDSPMINIYDLLGFVDRTPKFAKRYADIKKEAVTATRRYVEEVISCQYPGPEHSYSMKKGEAEKLRELLDE
jgi:3-methyl-2-oxobutanoate hydroxymethyltransferase